MARKTKTVLLFCMNDRGADRRSCAGSGAALLRKYAKEKAPAYPGLKVKKSGCLGHCKHGPVVELRPQETIYRCETTADVDLLLTKQIGQGEPVKSLLIKPGKAAKADTSGDRKGRGKKKTAKKE